MPSGHTPSASIVLSITASLNGGWKLLHRAHAPLRNCVAHVPDQEHCEQLETELAALRLDLGAERSRVGDHAAQLQKAREEAQEAVAALSSAKTEAQNKADLAERWAQAICLIVLLKTCTIFAARCTMALCDLDS
jgi:hypothetical protein